MHESLILFKVIIELTWFRKIPVVLLLNKKDLFREKIQTSPIRNFFPDYTATNNTFFEALTFFADQFRAIAVRAKREIYIQYTNATDPNEHTVAQALRHYVRPAVKTPGMTPQ